MAVAVFLYVTVALCAAWYASSAVVVPHAHPTAVVSWLLSLDSCQIHVACRLETARADILSLQSPVFSNAQLVALSY